ncbi:MAG TPA: outer membrane protein assembly factor BamD [Gammaproteobacteria bacterium]|jgi:outer membrane protein assembly factor BamD|nr:outer membrane protein assembly factor BamD [Gammaproteobacteria bacterium]
MRLRLTLTALLAAALLIGGCASEQTKDQTLAAQDLYSQIQANIKAGNYKTAIQRLQTLESRFPFNDFGTEAQLELIYVNYLSRDYDTSEDSADRFIREHPRHPNVDYAYYMKGVAYFDQAPGLMETLFNKDTYQRDPGNAEKSFQAFQLFLQKFPNSKYAPDARQRMVYLRDRLAKFEWAVADYYMRRGAWIAALHRAYNIVNHYPQSPSLKEALQIMTTAYTRLGLTQLADDSKKTLELNFPGTSPEYKAHGPS